MTVHLPPVLAAVTGGARRFEARGGTVRAVLEDLAASMPGLGLHLFDEAGALRPHIVCIHRDVVVRAHQAAKHEVRPGDEITLTNALAGG
ncbi:MAG: MoaD/ThiS family protein [Alphaproteobacteria bacterium]